MDVDMDELLITTSKLTVAIEESPESVVELTRQLLARGLPLALASVYASEQNRFIPVHKTARTFRKRTDHKVHCKRCSKLQQIDFVKQQNRPKPHACADRAVRETAATKEAGGWRRVLENVEAKGWKLGPGPHDEADSERYLGKDIVDAVFPTLAARRLACRPKKVKQDGSLANPKDLPRGLPEHVSLGHKGKNKKVKTRIQREKGAESRAVSAIMNMQLGENPSKEERRQARARARDTIYGQSRKQNATNAGTQQVLPAFDLRDLGKQLDSLSSATTEDQPSMLT